MSYHYPKAAAAQVARLILHPNRLLEPYPDQPSPLTVPLTLHHVSLRHAHAPCPWLALGLGLRPVLGLGLGLGLVVLLK